MTAANRWTPGAANENSGGHECAVEACPSRKPQHRVAVELLQALADSGHTLCLVPQIIYEYWVACTRPVNVNGLGMDIHTADVAVQGLLSDFELLRDERGIFARWHSLVVDHQVSGKNAHDARLVAAMQRHAVTHLLTFNQPDFSRFPSVITLSPEDITAGRVP